MKTSAASDPGSKAKKGQEPETDAAETLAGAVQALCPPPRPLAPGSRAHPDRLVGL